MEMNPNSPIVQDVSPLTVERSRYRPGMAQRVPGS